jgi:hypothetical protein
VLYENINDGGNNASLDTHGLLPFVFASLFVCARRADSARQDTSCSTRVCRRETGHRQFGKLDAFARQDRVALSPAILTLSTVLAALSPRPAAR